MLRRYSNRPDLLEDLKMTGSVRQPGKRFTEVQRIQWQQAELRPASRQLPDDHARADFADVLFQIYFQLGIVRPIVVRRADIRAAYTRSM